MAMTNAAIAAAFEEIAELLELQQANPFRVRAYRNAARTIAAWPQALAEWPGQGRDFDDLPGVGEDLAGKITQLLERGTCDQLEQLRDQVPVGLEQLLKVPGLGPKRVQALYRALDIRSPAQALQAARAGRIRTLPGFGTLSERRLLQALQRHMERNRRWPRGQVRGEVDALLQHLRAATGVADAVVAGSYRRCRDTVGDIDILVVMAPGAGLARCVRGFRGVRQWLVKGPTRVSVILGSGLQVDLRAIRKSGFGAAMVYFTGSRAHNLHLRRMARARHMKINEYGVYRNAKRIAGATETSVYSSMGLPLIPPELREDLGEIEAAASGTLPVLVRRSDLRGDLHAHTDASDGQDTLQAMVRAAQAAGLTYVAITDHSHSLRVAHGLDRDRLLAQIDAIDRLNADLHGITVLKGLEVDILPDGRLDMDDATLARLDLVVGAVHSAFDLPRERQTDRILRAMDSPCFSILAHPNGRLLGHRDACELDMDRIIRHAAARGCCLELNAQPERLDLLDVQCRQARDAGVPVVISSDAHRTADFTLLDDGIEQARRGWLRPGDVLNTLPLARLRQRLTATMTLRRTG